MRVSALVALLAASIAHAQSWTRQAGFIPLLNEKGKVSFQISRLNQDLLYFVGVSKGIGSVDLGVDRGASYVSAVIYFDRVGSRVNVVERNLKFRALHGNAALQNTFSDSFADSVIASLPIDYESNGEIFVDATPLLVRDAINLEGLLRRQNQGAYKLDPTRSSVDLSHTKAFPKNTECEATLTFASDAPGPILNSVAPDGRSVTIRIHHSFLQPPDNGYRPREGDDRIGTAGFSFKDYSKPFDTETDTHWVRRFRLEKKDPTARLSEPKQPLVYYLDAGIPEPIRTAMRNGILWWNQAFEAAGFRNAIVVRDPTPDMDPMDIRYNFVFWVNRDSRGFSVGGSFIDPRTGEIIAARARMDSARIRTIATYWNAYQATGISQQDLVTWRQALVTAHEVGHTLGFPHAWNSSINDNASVMEYPSPRIKLTADGKVDLSDAYQKRIGAFDTEMVRYAYTEFAPDTEKVGLEKIVADMRGRHLIFTPDTDPRWNRYDDGSDAVAYLKDTMAQRKILLAHYGPASLAIGEDLSHLRGEGLWMTYLHHRWAIDSGARYIGGMYHEYAHRGDSVAPTAIVPAAYQRQMLAQLVSALQPAELAIPDPLLAQLTTDPAERDSTTSHEEFHVSTGYAFDHLSAARTLSDMIVGQILQPETANRLISFADRQADPLTLPDVEKALLDGTWNASASSPGARSLLRVSRQVVLDDLMMLAANAKTGPEARAVTLQQLTELKTRIANMHDPGDAVTEAVLRQSERDLTRFLLNPSTAPKAAALPQPAGPPI